MQAVLLDSIAVYHQTVLEEVETETERAAIDSFYNKIITSLEIDTSAIFYGTVYGEHMVVKKKDIQTLSAEEIIEKYEIGGFINQSFIKQSMKFNKSPSAMIGSMIGNLTLMFLILIPCLAWVFKLLYIRGEWYYVEHLVFLFHYHSVAFFIGALMLVGADYLPNWLLVILAILLGFYLIFSLKNVYQQRWLKTILKFFTIAISYTIFFSICISVIMIVSFLLF